MLRKWRFVTASSFPSSILGFGLITDVMNPVLCFTGYYCDPKGCCPNGVSSSDCVTSIGGPLSIASSASVPQATGSSSTTGSKGAGTKNVNNEALGLVLGGLGVLLTL